jgi:hypothetical protein
MVAVLSEKVTPDGVFERARPALADVDLGFAELQDVAEDFEGDDTVVSGDMTAWG